MEKTHSSAFTAKCKAVLGRICKSKAPIRIIPAVEAIPASSGLQRSLWIGSMGDSIEILDDVISPANEESEWEALRD